MRDPEERESSGPARERAEEAWAALTRCLVAAPGGALLAKDGPRRGAARSALWPFGQVLAAAVALVPLGVVDVDAVVRPMLRGLERYRSGHGYGPFPGDRTRYFDDNAWIALDLLQLASVTGDDDHLRAAVELFAFVAEGAAPGGGVLWVEGRGSRNTCSTGPAAQIATRLFLATGDDRYLRFAEEQLVFLDRVLRDERGLYRDNVDERGRVEPTVWSYNQGTPVGAGVLLARATGDRSWLESARRTARAADEHFAGDGWWHQPPVFNAIHFRNLLALVASAPEPALLATLDGYLDRVWAEARDRRTGLLVAGGIGSYDRRPTIDHAGLTQLLAFRAWPRGRWPDIC